MCRIRIDKLLLLFREITMFDLKNEIRKALLDNEIRKALLAHLRSKVH